MTMHLTEIEVLAAIPALTRNRLVMFIEAELVTPLRREDEGARVHLFREADFVRLRWLCDLAEDLELDEATLGVVIGLIDQLHAARQDLLAISRAVASELPEVRARIGSAFLGSRQR